MMRIADFKAKMELAKQVQAYGGANPNIRDMVGQMMIVTGMHITRDIEIKTAGLILDKVTFFLADGSALDSFHTVAVERASDLIDVLGESAYPAPLMMEIQEMETRHGMRMYATLLDFYDPDHKLPLMEMDEPDEVAPVATPEVAPVAPPEVPQVEAPANGQPTT